MALYLYCCINTFIRKKITSKNVHLMPFLMNCICCTVLHLIRQGMQKKLHTICEISKGWWTKAVCFWFVSTLYLLFLNLTNLTLLFGVDNTWKWQITFTSVITVRVRLKSDLRKLSEIIFMDCFDLRTTVHRELSSIKQALSHFFYPSTTNEKDNQWIHELKLFSQYVSLFHCFWLLVYIWFTTM